MNKTFTKNLFRDIKKTISRFLSIVVIITVGVAFYSGVRATSPDMKMSGDLYFTENSLMDFKVISTLGITDEDISAIAGAEGVLNVYGSYSYDGIYKKDQSSQVVNLNSMPAENGTNSFRQISGRRPQKRNEAVVEHGFMQSNKVKLGDTITILSGDDKNIDQSLLNKEFTIVGTCESPLYISQQRQLSPVGNGSVRGFIYIMPEVFRNEVFTECYVKANIAESNTSLLKNNEYNDSVKGIENSLKAIGIRQSDKRYKDIIKSATDKINESEVQLNNSKKQAEESFAESYKLAAAMRNQSMADIVKLEEQKASAKFKVAEDEIQKNRDRLKELKKPEWYVLGRSENIGYETYRQDSERIDKIGKVFPMIFFLVAALVSLTTMTRMVQEKRIEIGTLKALGYSRFAIVSHYLIYSVSASLIGSIIGVSIGFKLFPKLIMDAYMSLYSIPYSVTPYDLRLALVSSLIAILFTASAAILATLDELREAPASLMRPKPPKAGKMILLERVSAVWKRLSFTEKVTARNIFRYKQRLFMTIFGIAACTALMISGFGLKESIIGATERQFSTIFKYDMQVNFNENVRQEYWQDIKNKLSKDYNIESAMPAYTKNSSVKYGDSENQDAHLVVPEEKTDFNKYVELTMKGRNLTLNDEGVIITEKLSRIINKNIGDIIPININGVVVEAKISDITENYIQHYIYMGPDLYEKLTGQKLYYNNMYGILKSKEETEENKTASIIKEIKEVNSVSFKKNIHVDYNKSMKSINSVVLILIISAGVLAFVVIYNLTNINISERKRELATIKLLGFFNNELASYVYRENVILTIIGSLLGIPFGKLLTSYIIYTVETNVIMFLNKISIQYFIYSLFLTILFSVIVNLAMYNKFDKIDMIESLKSAE